MNTLRMTISIWTGFCFLLLPLPMICIAQQEESPADTLKAESPDESRPNGEIEVVIRFSKGLFESLTRQEIEMTLPIQRVMEGIPVNGSVVGQGKTNIELNASEIRSEFVINVPGTANASFSANAGPATAYSSAFVSYFSCKRIVFDGKQFTQGPTWSSTNARTCVNSICPKRRGPIGRLVKRVGWCITRKKMSEINQAVEQVAKEILADTFDKAAAELITELNKITRFEATVAKYFPEAKSYLYRLATTPDSLLAGVGAPDAYFPILPPAKAHIEVWLKTRPLEAMFLETLAEWNVAHDVLREFLPDEEAKTIADDLAVETVNGWSILRIGIAEKENGNKP